MIPAPGVSSNDAAILAAVSDWLAQSRMPLPAGLRLRIDVVARVPVEEDPREIFPQGDVEIRAGEPLGWVHLTSSDVVRHRIVQDIVDAYERATPAEPTR